MEFRSKDKDQYIFLLSVFPKESTSGVPIYFIILDVSDEKKKTSVKNEEITRNSPEIYRQRV